MADQSAKVVITAQNATAPGIRGVQRDLQGLQKQAQSLTGSLKGMAGALGISVGVSAGITALKSFVTSTIELNDALANTANKTGMTVEELSALQYAAKQADVEFGTLSAALVKFNRGIAEANTGNKSAASAFTQLGISLSTVKALKPDELFLLAAQRISELGSEAERTKAEVDLFGRSGAELDPLFTGGAEGINRAKEAEYWEDIRLKLNAGEQRFYADMNEMAMDYADNTIEQIQRETEARLDAKDTYREWLKEQAKETELLGEIGAQAARNIQDAFAQFLFDPFKGGLKGMLKGFIDVVRQMIAQAASFSILKSFFTWMSGLSGGFGSIGGTLLKGLLGKAVGGSVMGNRPYMVGERGPELFVPQTSGSITPNNRLGSGVTVSPVYNIDARGATADLVKSLPAILEANTRRAVELARATIYDDYSRGAFGRA